jgi:hypothetical protein
MQLLLLPLLFVMCFLFCFVCHSERSEEPPHFAFAFALFAFAFVFVFAFAFAGVLAFAPLGLSVGL